MSGPAGGSPGYVLAGKDAAWLQAYEYHVRGDLPAIRMFRSGQADIGAMLAGLLESWLETRELPDFNELHKTLGVDQMCLAYISSTVKQTHSLSAAGILVLPSMKVPAFPYNCGSADALYTAQQYLNKVKQGADEDEEEEEKEAEALGEEEEGKGVGKEVGKKREMEE